MKLAMSNIAWAPEQASAAYRLLVAHGFTGLEIAPGLTFPGEADPFRPSPAAVARLRAELAARGLSLVSMQSLLFGVEGAQLFGSKEERTRFEAALLRAIDLAETLSVPNLVFGSPGNRAYPDDWSRAQATAQAIESFRRVGDRALAAGTQLAIEPNPTVYGTNFLTTVAETARFVVAAGHPAITLNYDIGALHINGEADEAGSIYDSAGGRVSHVHISEPNLAPAPAEAGPLAQIAAALIGRGYDNWFSIEMRRPPHDDELTEITQRIGLAADAMARARTLADA